MLKFYFLQRRYYFFLFLYIHYNITINEAELIYPLKHEYMKSQFLYKTCASNEHIGERRIGEKISHCNELIYLLLFN